MKKTALCLAVLLLLLCGCSTPSFTPTDSVNVTLPTLSGKEFGNLDVTGREPLPPSVLPDEDRNHPTLHHGEDVPVSAHDAVVFVAEVNEASKRSPSAEQTWSIRLPASGVFTFGETAPLSLSASAEDDGTVTVRFQTEDCYVQNGRLQQKAERVSVTFNETVYVSVRSDGTEAVYAIWLGKAE